MSAGHFWYQLAIFFFLCLSPRVRVVLDIVRNLWLLVNRFCIAPRIRERARTVERTAVAFATQGREGPSCQMVVPFARVSFSLNVEGVASFFLWTNRCFEGCTAVNEYVQQYST